MPLDPSIIAPSATLLQSIANPEPLPSIADIQSKQLALQNARLQSQSTAADIQQKQLEQQQQQEVVQAFHDNQGDVDKAIAQLQARGNPQAFTLAQHRDTMQKAIDEHQKTILDNAAHKADIIGRAANAVLNAPEATRGWIYQGKKSELESSGITQPGDLPPTYTGPEMEPQLKALITNSQSVKDQVDSARAKSEATKADVETAGKQRTDILNTLSAATSDADYQQKLADLKNRGIPDNALAEFKGKTWTPAFAQNLQTQAVPVEQRPAVAKALAEAQAKQLDLANQRLLGVVGKGPEAWAAALGQESPEVQKYYANLGPNPALGQVQQAGLTGMQQITAAQKQKELALASTRNVIEQQNARARMSLADSAAADREVNNLAKPYRASLTAGQNQLEKINDALGDLRSNNAVGLAASVPKFLTATLSGQGTGVRITQPELNAIGHARGIVGDVQAGIQKLTSGKPLIPEQAQQLEGILRDVQARVQQKIQMSNDTINQLQDAPDRDTRTKVDQAGRDRINKLETAGGAPPVPDKLSQSDVGKTYYSAKQHKPIKIIAVKADDPKAFQWEPVQ